MASAAHKSLGRPVEILLVEDNHDDVALTKEAFRRAEIPNTISVAGDGEEALRMLRREEPHTNQALPDVILLDLNLPRIQGRDVIEQISRDIVISKIPIIVLTSSDAHADILKTYALSAASYIVKPVTHESIQKIVALIERGTRTDPPFGGAPSPPDSTEAEQELREFSYIVSHDLSASLRHVAAFSLLLMRELGPDATGTQTEYCEHILRATNKCQSMLDALLAFSRVQQAPLDLQMCDATRLMEVALLQLSAEVQAAGAEIEIAPLGTAFMDPTLMTLAFRHALSNAFKFAQPGVAIKVDVRAQETTDAWTVQIMDNGRGVALERQEKLFRLFYQDESEGTAEGVGAGLAICRRIVRRHGGKVCFIETQAGASLEIRLPAASRPVLSE